MSKIKIEWAKPIRVLELEAPDGMTDVLSVEVAFEDEYEAATVRDIAADAMRKIKGAVVDATGMRAHPTVRASFPGGLIAPRWLAKMSRRVQQAIRDVDYGEFIEVRRVTYAEQKAAREGGRDR